MKQPIEVSEFEAIVTDTCQGSKREVLERVLAGIDDREIHEDEYAADPMGNTESSKKGFNQANATTRAFIEKLLAELE